MVDVTDAELRAAEARGRKMFATEARASSARYDRATGRVVIDLTNGCSYAFPVRLVQDLENASEADLETVQVEGLGFDLYWPKLGVDLYVPTLVAGIFGTRVWMTSKLARVAGQITSVAGKAAARKNGVKSVRPRMAAKN